ncbi:MAG TPA: ThuA domain-containing protein [Bacteroidia bacterium]|nr:ThuA domain-containing protein [Bacteroidia bacterium]
MKKITFLFLASICNCFLSHSQQCRVLHYTETSGFDHQTRNASFAMFQQMGAQYGFTVDDDSTGQSFNSLSNLQQYDAVIFSNTSGDNILDVVQKQNCEQYINDGGAFIGIHAASDTYRHSTANGTNTGGWDWYAETLGASVQQNPNHVNGTPVYRIDAIATHQLLNYIPNPWYKAEEYYYWESGYFDSTNIALQKVEQTIGPNNIVNSYDSARAVTWYKILPGGGRSFYTSLGHDVSNYTSDTSFYRLLSNALLWSCDSTSGINILPRDEAISIYPNPVKNKLAIGNKQRPIVRVEIIDLLGQKIYSAKPETRSQKSTIIDVSHLASGIYFIRLSDGKNMQQAKFVKQ